MGDDPRAELDRTSTELHDMEEAEGLETAAGGLLHPARMVLQELARATEFGDALNDAQR